MRQMRLKASDSFLGKRWRSLPYQVHSEMYRRLILVTVSVHAS